MISKKRVKRETHWTHPVCGPKIPSNRANLDFLGYPFSESQKGRKFPSIHKSSGPHAHRHPQAEEGNEQ
jgi:hypothetical protein